MVNHIGVHLVELEVRIDQMIDDGSKKAKTPLSFYGRFIGLGSKIIPGFKMYYALLFLLIVAMLIPASIKSWWTMSAWRFPAFLKIIFVVIPPSLMVIVRLIMRYVDRTALARIDAIRKSKTLAL
jgi:hypothetical protein